jgi:hypothetical protein
MRSTPRHGCLVLARRALLCAVFVACAAHAEPADFPESRITPQPVPPTPTSDSSNEVMIEAPEPRYVAPTLRDRIGRIWAPVTINGLGPFRLVLDTGATHSGVTAHVAAALGISLTDAKLVRLVGVTGATDVPTIHIDTLTVGDLEMGSTVLPIVTDALGGAEGVLGTEGLFDKRIYIDFRHDLITIKRSHNERAGWHFQTVPFRFSRGNLLLVRAQIGDIPCDAIIDTGGQTSVGNISLRNALQRSMHGRPYAAEVQGVTEDIQRGDAVYVPPITFAGLKVAGARVIFGDIQIFDHWQMNGRPVVLIGMDTLGLLDTLIIDYQRHELQIRTLGN